jgi:hypothetical protein
MATKTPETPKAAEPTTAVAVKSVNAVAMPVNWRDRMKAVAVKAAEAEKPTGSYISFKAGRLNIGDQVMPGDKIECIVVDSLFHNKWFSTDYDSKKVTPPACYAFAREEDDLVPAETADDPQGSNGEDGAFCAGCPKNEWGSSPKGGRGKACTNSRRLWLIPAGVINDPAKIGRTDFLNCDLPATSVRNYSKFVNDAASAGLPPFAFVVEMSVKPHDDYLFQVHFKAMEQIKNEAALEQLALRQWKLENEPHPKYPTAEEMEERNTPASKKY